MTVTTVRKIIKRDIAERIEGVVKVFDQASLATEIREYVVTDKIEEELKRIFDTFTQVSETIRRGGAGRDVVGMWISGFFGSGKSHFAKVLGYLLQNDQLDDGSGEYCNDVFVKHLSDSPRGKAVRLRLGEVKHSTEIRTIAFEIKSRQSLTNPNSVGEILISEFYRHIGLAENFVVARIERRLEQRGLLDKLATTYEAEFGVPWRSVDGRDDLMTVRRRLAEVLPKVDPSEYVDARSARNALNDMFRYQNITAEGIADELVAWVDAQPTTDGKVQHLVFVIDEMGTFIGDSNERIGEFNSLAEMIGNKGKGKVWLVVTSQQDLEKVVDRTNFQPALVGRLNARFELKPHLISDEINKVVSERILKKHPAEEPALLSLYQAHEGPIAQLADIKASRHLGTVSERTFIDCYPFLPHQIRLAQDIFEALSGFRISGGVRSMISVVMEALQGLADEEIGVVVSFDQVFDAVENDLLSQEYLGASGVQAIRESGERLSGAPIDPARVLKVLWLLQRITWVPRVPETLAKLLVQRLDTEIAPLRKQVETTLEQLQEAGYVARDEATREWKFLSERERTIEQAIQEMVRPGGAKSFSIAAVRRTSQQMAKESVVIRRRLGNFAVPYGKTKVPFNFGVYLDGEAILTGPEIEVLFMSPLTPGRKQEIEEIRRRNQVGGAKGRRLWWVSSVPEHLEVRFKRYEALVKVTGDKRFTDDSSADTQDALSEKRKERDELREALIGEIERAFLDGTIFFGGQEIELDGVAELKEPINNALTNIIPNIYPRFSLADRNFDFGKNLKELLNPATSKLHTVASELDLFDTQGSLQRESDLVSQVLEVITDLEDEGIKPTGSHLIDAKDNKGFKGFERPPFGWPAETVRLVLAACLRAGAIHLERQSSTGPDSVYDYKGTVNVFGKVNTFKKTTFRVAETSLTVAQIKQAAKALIAMEVTGTTESGNAIAAAVRDLGATLNSGIGTAKLRSQQSLPIHDALISGEAVLVEPMTAKNPTAAVIAFLSSADTWKDIHVKLKALQDFLDANRHNEFAASRQLVELITSHPVPDGHASDAAISQACRDMNAIIEGKTVIERWADYRSAFDQAYSAYRAVYQQAYEEIRRDVEEAVREIRGAEPYTQAPKDQRDQVVDAVFAAGRICHYPQTSIASAAQLIEAAGRRSLTSLDQARVALPGYRARVEMDLRKLAAPPPKPDEKVFEWRLKDVFAGRRFVTEEEVEDAFEQATMKLQESAEELKARIRDGCTVVVK
ncbi:MAG: BREX system P-loop protein BrxC [Chloroflexi bacterium]|nr:BREX system P-loop protein BrxC [Chloroflexota bacterium]